MEYILGIFVIILAFIIWGYFFKKKHFKEIDRLEAWKIEIMNRPVLEELSKVKQLNMTGETEEMFEKWRNEWDAIITVHMPDVEELLFDAEEYVDKYRFAKSKEVQDKIISKLNEIEETIQKILSELNELVGSEEKNRVEIEELKETYRSAKKSLLAHRHSYGKAAGRLEMLLDEILEILQQYENATENGNYLNARELVLSIKAMLTGIEAKMEWIPKLLVESQSSLPSQIEELKEGYQEMVSQGYSLDHIQFERETARIESELGLFAEHLEKAEIAEVELGLKEIVESVNVLYELLEKEVYSKQYIQKNDELLAEDITGLEYENDKLKAETAVVQHSYHLTESELEAQRKLEKQISQISKRYNLLRGRMEENIDAHSALSEEMQGMEVQIKALKDEQKLFSGKLQALRKDEMEVRDTLKDLKKKMSDTSRMIAKSNIPGVPEEYRSHIFEARESLDDVQNKLEEKPLDMASVQIYLEKAVSTVNGLRDRTRELVEQMFLAEKLIQFGNRYRSQYPVVAAGLKDAEEKFRSYEYEGALEAAASVIEKVDPGSLKKLEANLEEVLL
ncbi:septation ring formation regulator EzrA [Peribacillus cavernae]|uniref:Septation ring formation regulator EzrA n=1 Tax=Peribacillus cavernae TaxID=1674310 RepID=A0A433HH28_9BACI|nr:septation ring formation regulator EzrA [Peribacillus cavernae]MDQ0221086.1 septation ring formation regulator [Peribacillus cavernae]RUQ27620.1 septation ring formation regulator EzrA [Peribacillus cavernae]